MKYYNCLLLVCFIFLNLFLVENIYAQTSGNENHSLSKSNIYGNVNITNWADDRNSAFSFSFDDGFLSHYVNVREILNQFDFKATFYLLPEFLADSLPSVIWRYGTWPMFLQMSNEGHELGSHTLNHDTLTQLPIGDTLTPGTIHYELYHSQKMINERAPNQKCITFAYPYAIHNSLVDSLAGIYYESARAISEFPNSAIINGEDWFTLSSYQVVFSLPRDSLDDDLDELFSFIDWINNSIANGEWGIQLAHEVVPFSELNTLLGEGSYHPISNEWLLSLCNWLDIKSNDKDIWVESIATITKYIKERESFYYNIIVHNNVAIEMEVGDNLPNEIYDYPLTAFISVPPDWEMIQFVQGNRTEVLNPFILDTSSVVMAKIIPDGGNVRLSKYNPNSISENENTQPEEFVLFQNYPNPFNPNTIIQYFVGKKQFVTLKVHDILGNEIATLVDEEKIAGEYKINFNGSSLPSGVYFYTLETAGKRISQKMLLIK